MKLGARGIVLGKFMPPHLGHLHLLQVAQRLCAELTIVVDVPDAAAEIPIDERCAWLRELAPTARVVALSEPRPQQPAEHPRFWEVWRQTLLEAHGAPGPDVLFAGETYGARLAADLGVRFVPVGPREVGVPIRASAIRSDPPACWRWLPAPVRAYYARRVSVFGPESTGKTTLAARLATRFGATLVPEFAREFLAARDGRIAAGDLVAIAMGQAASEDSLARLGEPLLVCDTDPLATVVWNEFVGADADTAVLEDLAERRRYDLTLLLAPDVPWVGDAVRYLPDGGQAFFDRCRARLERSGRAYVVVAGSWEQRWQTAEAAVAQRLAAPANVD